MLLYSISLYKNPVSVHLFIERINTFFVIDKYTVHILTFFALFVKQNNDRIRNKWSIVYFILI